MFLSLDSRCTGMNKTFSSPPSRPLQIVGRLSYLKPKNSSLGRVIALPSKKGWVKEVKSNWKGRSNGGRVDPYGFAL